MKPGEYRFGHGKIVCHQGRTTRKLLVAHTGDRPVQVGSHFHFAEVNRKLYFDRSLAIGMRLNIASGTAVRFEPGEEKEVELVEIGGRKHVYGCNGLTQGSVRNKDAILKRIQEQGFGSKNDT